jgi:hypothetical protein
VSEVQYHIYLLSGSYNVLVIAYDSGGNFGEALVTVSWPTPVPEFPITSMPLLASILMVITTAIMLRAERFKRRVH